MTDLPGNLSANTRPFPQPLHAHLCAHAHAELHKSPVTSFLTNQATASPGARLPARASLEHAGRACAVDRRYPRPHGPVTPASLHVPPEPARCTRGQLARTAFLPDEGRPQPDGAGFYSAEATGPPPTPGGRASTGLGWCPLGAQGPCPLGAARSAGPPGTSEVSSSQLLRGRAGVQQDGGRREAAGAQGPQGDGAGRRCGARAGPALGRVSQNAGPAATKTDGGSAPAACCTDPRAPDESEQHRTLCWLLGPPHPADGDAPQLPPAPAGPGRPAPLRLFRSPEAQRCATVFKMGRLTTADPGARRLAPAPRARQEEDPWESGLQPLNSALRSPRAHGAERLVP